jgi:DNA replication protein DnaC
MNPMPQLMPLLKQLRLSGILDSLEIRNRQAVEEKLAYTQFLALLLQDEMARRENKNFSARLRRASFRNEKTLEGFDFSFNPEIPISLVMDLATCRFIEEKNPVLMTGPTGTGKSHIAQAIGHEALRKGYNVLFQSQSNLLGQLHAARATHAYDRRFTNLARVDLLIIDDFGLKPLQSPHDEDLHDLICERYERHATIVTSNLDLTEWNDAFPNKLLGAAVIDRLRHDAYCVVLDGDTYRKPKTMPKPAKTKLS